MWPNQKSEGKEMYYVSFMGTTTKSPVDRGGGEERVITTVYTVYTTLPVLFSWDFYHSDS